LAGQVGKDGDRRSVFFELSRSLSSTERDELLNSINKSLKMNTPRGSEPPSSSDTDELNLRLMQEFKRISLWERFMLWLKKHLTGKGYEALMLEMKLDRLKRTIRKNNQSLTGFETRDLKPGFAQELWPLYEDSLLLYSCFDKLFGKSGLFRDVMISLFQNELKESIKSPEQVYSREEMIEVFRREGSDEAVRRKGAELLDEELEQVIDKQLLKRLESAVAPILAADRLVRFPFKRMFGAFGVVGVDPMDMYQATGNIPTFRNATAVTMLDQLEQLFHGLYLLSITVESDPLTLNVADIVLSVCRKRSAREEESEAFLSHFKHLVETAESFLDASSLPELIRFFRRDPYYKIRIVQEKMDLKAFFRTTRKIIMREYIEEELPGVRDEATDRNIREIFAEGDVERLKNYRTYQSIAYDELALPMFLFQRSLALLYAFCTKNYRNDIQETVQILDRGLYALNRVERDRLLMHASAIEDVEEEIRKLDHSLSSEESDGKLFQRLRFSMGGDQGQSRMFRSLVQQKDSEAASIVRRGCEAVDGLKRIFEDTLKIRNESGTQALNQHYFVKGTPVALRSIIDRNIATLRRFSFVMQQIKRMES